MKNMLIKSASMLLAFTGLFSCRGSSQYNTAKDNKSLLWEVSGNHLQKHAYVYGTMHLLCSKDAELSVNLKNIIQHVDEIYFEIDMDDLGQIFSGFKMGLMKEDTTLSMLYTPDEYERVQSFFEINGMGMQLKMLSKIQPMLMSALVYEAVLPCTQTEGIELNIMQLAKQYTKEIKGLETAAFQSAILEKIPYSQQAKELLFSIDSINTTKMQAEEMAKLYREQDLDKLLEYSLVTDGGTTSEVQDVMIDQRNINWVNQFPDITRDKNILIAVGAGHLGGANGLLSLLVKKGYTVRAIEN